MKHYSIALFLVAGIFISCTKQLESYPEQPDIQTPDNKLITFLLDDHSNSKSPQIVSSIGSFKVSSTTGTDSNQTSVWQNVTFNDNGRGSFSSDRVWPNTNPYYRFYACNADMSHSSSGETVRIDDIGKLNKEIVCAYIENSEFQKANTLSFEHILARVGRVNISNLKDFSDVSIKMYYYSKGTYYLMSKEWKDTGYRSSRILSSDEDNDFWIIPGSYDITLTFKDASDKTIRKNVNAEFCAGYVNDIIVDLNDCNDVVIRKEETECTNTKWVLTDSEDADWYVGIELDRKSSSTVPATGGHVDISLNAFHFNYQRQKEQQRTGIKTTYTYKDGHSTVYYDYSTAEWKDTGNTRRTNGTKVIDEIDYSSISLSDGASSWLHVSDGTIDENYSKSRSANITVTHPLNSEIKKSVILSQNAAEVSYVLKIDPTEKSIKYSEKADFRALLMMKINNNSWKEYQDVTMMAAWSQTSGPTQTYEGGGSYVGNNVGTAGIRAVSNDGNGNSISANASMTVENLVAEKILVTGSERNLGSTFSLMGRYTKHVNGVREKSLNINDTYFTFEIVSGSALSQNNGENSFTAQGKGYAEIKITNKESGFYTIKEICVVDKTESWLEIEIPSNAMLSEVGTESDATYTEKKMNGCPVIYARRPGINFKAILHNSVNGVETGTVDVTQNATWTVPKGYGSFKMGKGLFSSDNGDHSYSIIQAYYNGKTSRIGVAIHRPDTLTMVPGSQLVLNEGSDDNYSEEKTSSTAAAVIYWKPMDDDTRKAVSVTNECKFGINDASLTNISYSEDSEYSLLKNGDYSTAYMKMKFTQNHILITPVAPTEGTVRSATIWADFITEDGRKLSSYSSISYYPLGW